MKQSGRPPLVPSLLSMFLQTDKKPQHFLKDVACAPPAGLNMTPAVSTRIAGNQFLLVSEWTAQKPASVLPSETQPKQGPTVVFAFCNVPFLGRVPLAPAKLSGKATHGAFPL